MMPGECECRCHDYGSTIKDCKCGCRDCPHCKKHFMIGLISYHILICEPYYKAGLDKKKKDERQCGC